MRYPIAISGFLSLSLLAASASAETPKDQADENPEDVICKYSKVVDSKIPQRICLTRFEWEDRRRAQMEAKRSSKNRNSYCSEPSGPC